MKFKAHIDIMPLEALLDPQGKAVSQFTASTLIGVAIGLGITKVIDITSLYHLIPNFILLSVV